jgi:glycosyltransferase involved in cell wall biosynthesis
MVQRLPNPARHYRHYLPLFPAAIEWFNLDDADLVISTSHCAAKSVVVTGRARHVCYCHSPMRYAWDQFDAYFGVERLGRLGHAAARLVMAPIARWDRSTAHRVHHYVANSRHVAGRIARYYNRESTVLHPPVDTSFFTPNGTPPSSTFLVVSALVPYKRLDVAIDAASRIGAPLTVVGDGPDMARLRARAAANVQFLGSVDDNTLRDLYRSARAVVLPGEEDFGIVPVEAMACGRPAVALSRGGTLDTVVHGRTGLLVDELSVDAFADAMRAIERTAFDPAEIRTHAEQFDTSRFEQAFACLVAQTLTEQRAAC